MTGIRALPCIHIMKPDGAGIWCIRISGFDEMHFIDYFDQTKILREYITDQELYDKIIKRYENRKNNEKLFFMGITMQNHGGYTETYDNFPENYYKVGRSYTDANRYLSLVHESDEAVKT